MKVPPRLDEIKNTEASDHLNLVRGLAAVAVLIGHVRALFFLNYSSLPTHSLALGLFYFIAGLGHEAVMIFFVLSGYFIGTAVLRSTSAQWSWERYLTHRLCRLLAVLLPALCLGAIWDITGIHLFGASGIYGGHAQCDGVIPWPVANHLTAKIALGNLAFLQGIFVPTFGSNGPLWSLNYELWYYLLFPVSVLAVTLAVRKSLSAIAYCLIGLLICMLVTRPILDSFPVWLLGVAVALVVPYIRKPQFLLLGFAAILHFTALWFSRTHRLGPGGSDYAVGISFASVLLAVLTFRRTSGNSTYSHLAKSLAGFSYTLYLVHLPFLVFLRALLIHTDQRWPPSLEHGLLFCLICLLTITYAYGIATVTEFRTDSIRHWVEGLTRLSRPST
jgi:peptidoglycan/LPS O-acetylase OafA/YrhL